MYRIHLVYIKRMDSAENGLELALSTTSYVSADGGTVDVKTKHDLMSL